MPKRANGLPTKADASPVKVERSSSQASSRPQRGQLTTLRLCDEQVVTEAAFRLLSSLDTPRALAVWLLYSYGEHKQLVELPFPTMSSSFEEDYVATGFFKKSKFLRTGIDTRAVATESFWESESICRSFNERVSQPERALAAIQHARGKIAWLLRGLRPYQFLDYCSFGPGSDTETEGVRTSVYNKLSTSGSCTRGASLFKEFLFQHSLLGSYGRVFSEDEDYLHDARVPGNRLSFVPKNAKTDRIIAIEPRWNIFLQKGMGQLLRIALRRAGIDIRVQSELNKQLARQGSRDNSYATIDLSSASDSIPKSLVKELMPPEWYEVLDRLRSPMTRIGDDWHDNAKFSSMGNGFTFELETLLFYVIASRHDDETSVFGDDIVCRTDFAKDVVADLESLSFRVNKGKTFVDGPFKESCGYDCYHGRLVTPFYLKDLGNERDYIQFANGLSALATRLGDGLYRDRRAHSAWKFILTKIRDKHFGPCELSGSIHDDSVRPIRDRRTESWDGHTFLTKVFRPRLFRFTRMGPALLANLMSPSSDGYSVRQLGVYVTRRVFLSRGYTVPPPWELPPTQLRG